MSTLNSERWSRKTHDRVLIRFPKGMKDKIIEVAKERGETLNGFIVEALTEKIASMQDSSSERHED
ncbi:MAG: Arc family DNA-binding protein [Clostridia bacterium]|nr:Arc family DNA-binding protein [Clostridia bacterium]MBT7123273.1 Arc family DNA-binding protein [Clostridia bacterium]